MISAEATMASVPCSGSTVALLPVNGDVELAGLGHHRPSRGRSCPRDVRPDVQAEYPVDFRMDQGAFPDHSRGAADLFFRRLK